MNVRRSACKLSLFLSYFNEISTILEKVSKSHQTSNFLTIRPVGAELFYANGRRDR